MNPNAKEGPFQEQYTLFVGLDWASDHHDVVAVDASGQVTLELALEDTAEGSATLRQKLMEHVGPDLSKAAVAVETCNGPAVERPLEMAWGYMIHPGRHAASR